MAVVAGSHKKRTSRCGEAAGDATAVMCCCPCTVIKLLVLALYKFPSKLCCCFCLNKKNKKRNNRKTNDLLLRKPMRDPPSVAERGGRDEEVATAVVEREMLERFSGRGFWRSGSRQDFDDDD